MTYVHPQDPNLNNLAKAMKLNDAGEPIIRVSQAEPMIVTGNVIIPGEVQVSSTPEDPVHVHLSEVGASGILTVPWMPIAGNVTIDGNPTVKLFSNSMVISNQPTVKFFSNAVTVSGQVRLTDAVDLSTDTLAALENITVTGNVNAVVTSGSITANQGTSPYVVVGNVNVSVTSMPEVEIKNDSGNPISVSRNTNANSTTNRIYVSMETDAVIADSNYYMNVARGLVTGQYSVQRSAYIAATPNTETSIWVEGGIYPHGTWTSASVLYIASSSSADTSLSIFVEGLDSSYNYQSETVTTNASNGTTTVTTAKQYIRIYTATITSASSNSSNAGDIRFRIGSASGTVVADIGIGIGITKLSQYTVPVGYTAYVQYGDVSTFKNGAGNQSGLVKMMVRQFNGSFVAAFMAQVSNGYYRNDFTVPLAVPAKADIDVRILTDATGATVSSNYQLILIPN